MNDSAQLVGEAARRLFRELGNPHSLKSDSQRDRFWGALEDAGLTRTWIPEALQGSGASLTEGFEVLRIGGEFALNVPLAETLLAGWLLQQASIPMPDGALTVAPVDIRDRTDISADGLLSGSARAVPFARNCRYIAMFAMREQQAHVALLKTSQCQIENLDNLAHEARDRITVKRTEPLVTAPLSIDFDALMLMGAVARAVAIAGALQGILDLSVSYANERIAFEKPIGKFQAIQHSLAKLAGETAAAVAAAGSAADAIDAAAESGSYDSAVFLEAASAKIRAGEAATQGAAIAHQVHGAIGISQEHVLHRYTQRLWAWRDDFGNESYWAARLGSLVAGRGADALWPMLAAR
jgi:acyl-CoA dehydrogenase